MKKTLGVLCLCIIHSSKYYNTGCCGMVVSNQQLYKKCIVPIYIIDVHEFPHTRQIKQV